MQVSSHSLQETDNLPQRETHAGKAQSSIEHDGFVPATPRMALGEVVNTVKQRFSTIQATPKVPSTVPRSNLRFPTTVSSSDSDVDEIECIRNIGFNDDCYWGDIDRMSPITSHGIFLNETFIEEDDYEYPPTEKMFISSEVDEYYAIMLDPEEKAMFAEMKSVEVPRYLASGIKFMSQNDIDEFEADYEPMPNESSIDFLSDVEDDGVM